MRVEGYDVAGARQRQVAAVEVPGHQVVEAVVVEAGKPVGAIGLGPDPVGEAGLDLDQLLLGRLGRLRVQHPSLAAVHDLDVVDLRRGAVQSVMQELACVPARCAPFRRAGRGACEA